MAETSRTLSKQLQLYKHQKNSSHNIYKSTSVIKLLLYTIHVIISIHIFLSLIQICDILFLLVFVVGLEVSKSLLKLRKLILFRNVTNPHMNIVLMQTKPHDARVNVNRSNMKLSSIKKLIRSESNLLRTY